MKKLTIISTCFLLIAFISLPALATDDCVGPLCDDDCVGCQYFYFNGGAGFGTDIGYQDDNNLNRAYGSAGLEYEVAGRTPMPNLDMNFSGYGNSDTAFGEDCGGRWANSNLDFNFNFNKTESW